MGKPKVTYEFTLPLPPSINNNKWVFRGRIIQKDSCREWKKEAAMLLLHIPTQKEQRRWELALTFYFYYVKKPRRYDWDNRLKSIIDAIKNRIGIDDSLLHCCTVQMQYLQGRENHKVLGSLTIL